MRKEEKKVPLDVERFRAVRNYRGMTLKEIAAKTGRAEKTLSNWRAARKAPEGALDEIARLLDVDPFVLEGYYDQRAEALTSDPHELQALKELITPQRYPYAKKVQRDQKPGNYLNSLLIYHEIPTERYEELSSEDQIRLLVDLDVAVSRVLHRYFRACSDSGESGYEYPFNEEEVISL